MNYRARWAIAAIAAQLMATVMVLAGFTVPWWEWRDTYGLGCYPDAGIWFCLDGFESARPLPAVTSWQAAVLFSVGLAIAARRLSAEDREKLTVELRVVAFFAMTLVGSIHVTAFGITPTPRRMIIVYVVCWALLGVTLFWRNRAVRTLVACAAALITIASGWYLVLPIVDLAASGCLAATVLVPLVGRFATSTPRLTT